MAAYLYRRDLDAPTMIPGLDEQTAAVVGDSLGGAVAVAEAANLPLLAERAGDAFTSGLGLTGLLGGAIMLAFALVVFLLTPRGTRLADLEH